MLRLDGKVAIVTGAARGQGAATAELLARQGARVVLTDLLEDEGEATARHIGDAALFRRHDVSREDHWRAIAEEIAAKFGRLDILVNNAAFSPGRTAIMELEREQFARVLDVNLIGSFLGMKAVIPHMMRAGRGAIINVASVNALRGTCFTGAYDASKWGLRGLTKSAAVELAPTGIRINTVLPGAIDTPMLNPNGKDTSEVVDAFRIGFGRTGLPGEVAAATLFLASDEASYVHGAELTVDGGWSAGVYLGDMPAKPETREG